jgi:hypothetical protein
MLDLIPRLLLAFVPIPAVPFSGGEDQMPILKIDLGERTPSPKFEQLKQRLLATMRGETSDQDPKIKICAQTGPYAGTDIIVIWDEFDGIAHLERARLIRECWRIVKGPSDPEDKTVMGFTTVEAQRQNISFDSKTFP